MNIQHNQNPKGFTIIEVVLVLAIAGLIILMVLIALPALQRGQRDSQRKQDLGLMQTALQRYQSNNRNAIPEGVTEWRSMVDQYVTPEDGETFDDPSRGEYAITTSTTDLSYNANSAVLQVAVGYTCDGESITGNAGAKKVAFRLALEGGGVACVNN